MGPRAASSKRNLRRLERKKNNQQPYASQHSNMDPKHVNTEENKPAQKSTHALLAIIDWCYRDCCAYQELK